MDKSTLIGKPDLRTLDSTVLQYDVRNEKLDSKELLNQLPYVDTLWNEFFTDFYGYVSHRDVMDGGKSNYFVDIFIKELSEFKKTVLPEASYASKINSGDPEVLLRISEDWKIHLKENSEFMLKTRNVMFWIFKLLQETLIVLEDSLVNKSNAIRIPERAIAEASKILRENPQAKLEVPQGADKAYIPLIGLFIPAFAPPDRSEEFRVVHHNALAKVFRDDIRTHRGIAQKNFALSAQRGGVINTAIEDHAGILKSVASLSEKLIKSIIAKLKTSNS
ncbi:MAG: hypothetical protein ACI9S8_002281 [Chlamydiales bacterium]|jgi:hypothetical protein